MCQLASLSDNRLFTKCSAQSSSAYDKYIDFRHSRTHQEGIAGQILPFDFSSYFGTFRLLFKDYENIFSNLDHAISKER